MIITGQVSSVCLCPYKKNYTTKTQLKVLLDCFGRFEVASIILGRTLGCNFVAITVSAAAEVSTAEKTSPPKAADSTPVSASGIEDLFKDLSPVTPSLTPEKPQKDVKNDIMRLFEKVLANSSVGLCKIVELLL